MQGFEAHRLTVKYQRRKLHLCVGKNLTQYTLCSDHSKLKTVAWTRPLPSSYKCRTCLFTTPSPISTVHPCHPRSSGPTPSGRTSKKSQNIGFPEQRSSMVGLQSFPQYHPSHRYWHCRNTHWAIGYWKYHVPITKRLFLLAALSAGQRYCVDFSRSSTVLGGDWWTTIWPNGKWRLPLMNSWQIVSEGLYQCNLPWRSLIAHCRPHLYFFSAFCWSIRL